MEPMSVIAAVTAASNAIGFIKARINDVQSVTEIGDQISTLFSAQQKLNEERNKQAGVGDINIRSSIDAVLEAKKLQQDMQEIATLICLRWPKPADQPSTWQEILNHHNEAIRQRKEAQKRAFREAQRLKHQREEAAKTFLIVTAIVLVSLGLFVLLFATIARAI